MDEEGGRRPAVGAAGGRRGGRLPPVLVGAAAVRQQLRVRRRALSAADLVGALLMKCGSKLCRGDGDFCQNYLRV